jgi:hypothetical protein
MTVTECTFSGGSYDGITNLGTGTVLGSTFIRNSDGGIISFGGLRIIDSTFSGNAGGIINGSGLLAVVGSTFNGNAAIGIGGGISNYLGTVAVTECTFNDNSETYPYPSDNGGGGIENHLGTLTVTDSTFSGNSASAGGGIYNHPGGNVMVRNTLLAGNHASNGPDVFGTLKSQGHNLIGDGSGGSGYAATDLVGTSLNPIDPKLGPLQDNGGPAQTMALFPGSPAFAAGGPSDSEWDQRGPGYPRTVNGSTDIGAYEVQPGARTSAWVGPSAFPEVVRGMETTTPQPPAWNLSRTGPLGLPVPVNPAAAAVDRIYASWNRMAAGVESGRQRHAAPAEVGFRSFGLFLSMVMLMASDY